MPSRLRAGHSARTALRAGAGRPACALAAWCLVTTAALAQPAGGLSFERAQTLATERAPMLAARQASVDAAGQLRTSADQLPDPKLLVGIDNVPISGPDWWSLSSDPMTQRNIGWMQDMPNAAKRAARAQVAEARTERERAALDAERLAIQREVAQAWLARHFAERQLALFQALEDENRVLRGTVSSRIAGGMAMPADATMARQEALMLADRRDGLVRQRAQALASLKRWLGDEALQPLAGDPPALVVDAAALHAGIERHADLRTFDPMTRMANADVAELEAMKKGDWNWQVMYSNRASAYGDMVSFQLGFELPLWGDKRQDPQIAAKRKEVERITAEREDLLRRRREEIEMQLADLDELTRMLERLQASSTPLANERVALAMAAYQSARGDLAAVLSARRERAELGLRAIELKAKQYTLRAKLNYLIAEPR
jgi:outer membrane protein, heavy metal efflux system